MRAPAPRTPAVIDQPLSEWAASIDQLVPGLLGSVSLPVTLLSIPAPELVSVIVNPIWSPAETVAASSTLSLHDALPISTTEASSWPLPSLEVLTVAVLSTVPQLSL